MTWCSVAFHASIMVPFILTDTFEDLTTFDSLFNLGLIITFGLLVGSFLIASIFYAKIYIFARLQAAEAQALSAELAAAQATASAVASAHSQQQNSQASGQHINPFDDSSDDEDLIDPSETPSAKQSSAVLLALKTMLVLVLIHLTCILVLTLDTKEYPNSLKYGIIVILLALVRSPGKLIAYILNFRPIRNTVSLYLENLPDHFQNLIENWFDYLSNLRSSNDDQRSIVIVSNDEHTSPVMMNGDECLNIIGNRESAVSPANSNDSLSQLPAVQC